MAFGRKKKDDYTQIGDEENPYQKKNDDKYSPVEGPKKFNMFPTKKKRFIREESLALRKCFAWMLPLHVIFLIVFDFYLYDIEIMAIIAEIVLIYLNYVNYMTLNKMFMLA